MNESNGSINRRSMLAATGAATGAATLPFLTACGGGEELSLEAEQPMLSDDSTTDKEQPNAIAPAVARIVPFDLQRRSVYQIEVCHNGRSDKGGTTVKIGIQSQISGASNLTKAPVLISTRYKGSDEIFELHFATLDTERALYNVKTGQDMGDVCDAIYLIVEHEGVLKRTIRYNTKDSNGVTRNIHIDHNGKNEIEWLFATTGTASHANFNVAVRFIEVARDVPAVASSWISSIAWALSPRDQRYNFPIYKNIKTDSNGNNKYEIDSLQAGAIIDANFEVKDTIAIPSHRSLGHYELVPCLSDMKSNSIHRGYVKRRLARHLAKFGDEIIKKFPNADINPSVISDELNMLILGKTKTDVLSWFNSSLMARKKDMRLDADIMTTTLKSEILNLDKVVRDDAMVRKLKSVNEKVGGKSYGCAVTAGFVAQAFIGGKFTADLGSVLIPSKMGVRFTFTLAKWNYASGGGVSSQSTYRALDADHLRVAYTFVIGPQSFEEILGEKLPNWVARWLPGFETDIEVTVATRWRNGICRIDGVGSDWIFDIDTGGWAKSLFDSMMRKINGTPDLSSDIPDPPELIAQDANVIVGGFSETALGKLGIPAAAIKAFVNRVNEYTSKLAILEGTLTRNHCANSDTVERLPSDPYRTGFQGSILWSFGPATNFSGGLAIAWPKNVRVISYLRTLAFIDVAYIDAGPDTRKAFGIAMVP